MAGAAAAAGTAAPIWLGSRNLRHFDAALVGYATATVMLAFGVVYRYGKTAQVTLTQQLAALVVGQLLPAVVTHGSGSSFGRGKSWPGRDLRP